MANREDVFTALTALLTNVPGINSVSRRMSMPAEFDTIGDTRLPRLMIWEQHEETKHKGLGLPANRTWEAYLVVYFRNETDNIPGATIINPIIDGIEAALAPSVVTGKQTLGGIVSHAWIEGVTTVALGDVDTNGFGGAVVPVKILVP